MNKKGEERILSFWWIFVFGVIAVFIVTGTIAYYSETVDSRVIEADILLNKIIDCSASLGIDNLLVDKYDIYSNCKIQDIGLQGKKEYYIGIEEYALDSCKIDGRVVCQNTEKRVVFGEDLQAYCDLQKEKGIQRKLPQCSEKYVYLVDSKNNEKIIKITAASNQKSGEIWKS